MSRKSSSLDGKNPIMVSNIGSATLIWLRSEVQHFRSKNVFPGTLLVSAFKLRQASIAWNLISQGQTTRSAQHMERTKRGFLQGSSIGPLLWNLFQNDLSLHRQSERHAKHFYEAYRTSNIQRYSSTLTSLTCFACILHFRSANFKSEKTLNQL